MKRVKFTFRFAKTRERRFAQVNLLFVFVFLVVWDFVNNRQFLNAMILGAVIFAPATFLWFVGKFRAVALIVLISIFEFVVLLVFIAEGFQLSGLDSTLKSIFWLPYLVMAGINGYWALKIYSEMKEKKGKK